MKKFEYKVVPMEVSDLNELEARLCRLGREGWELIEIKQRKSVEVLQAFIFMKTTESIPHPMGQGFKR
jgi:hypothetical protein